MEAVMAHTKFEKDVEYPDIPEHPLDGPIPTD